MTEDQSSLFTELAPGQMELVDDVCLRFEAAWKAGQEPRIDDFLADVAEPVRSVLRGELTSLDREYRHGKLWYWVQGDKGAVRGGPFSWTELKDFAAQGRLAASDMISRKGMDSWVVASDVLLPPVDPTRNLAGGAAGSPQTGARPENSSQTGFEVLGEGENAHSTVLKAHSRLAIEPAGRAANSDKPSWPSIPGYEIEGVLGRGAMGKVFKARQTQLGGRLVALKVIITGQVAAAEELARFRLEADSLASLNHPNIVQVYEVGEWFTGDGSATLPFFSMEYVDGGTLAQRLAKTPQPPREAAHMLAILARAIHAAHLRGIIHRDLKPSNILLAASHAGGEFAARPLPQLSLARLEPKISDFGLAKHLNAAADLTQTGRLLGTPTYMAPEQALGKVKDIGPGTDVYALGSIFYEMLTGRPPFTSADDAGETIPVILEQIRNQEPIPPGRLVGRLPRDLETICLKCLYKEPGKRYVSAQALAEDLDRFLAGKPIKARPVGVAERTWRWCRRNPAVASLTAILIFVGVASFATMAYLWLQAEFDAEIAKRHLEEAKRQEKLLSQKFDPGPVRKIGIEEFRAEGKMTQNGYQLQLAADKTYVMKISSEEGKPYLLIWDSAGKRLEDVPFVRNKNKKMEWGGSAWLNFKPPRDDTYTVMVAFRETGQADYVFSVRERDPNEPKRGFPFWERK